MIFLWILPIKRIPLGKKYAFVSSSKNFVKSEFKNLNFIAFFCRGIYETLSSDEYFKNQETILINSVCDTLADPEKCENEVKVYWKYIAPGLFVPEAAKEYCAEPEINCTAQTGR